MSRGKLRHYPADAAAFDQATVVVANQYHVLYGILEQPEMTSWNHLYGQKNSLLYQPTPLTTGKITNNGASMITEHTVDELTISAQIGRNICTVNNLILKGSLPVRSS